MLDGESARIGGKAICSRIGASRRKVDEYVVPRLIAVGLCLVFRIPLVGGLARLVAVLLGLKAPPEEDAADALAVAITHIQASRSKAIPR